MSWFAYKQTVWENATQSQRAFLKSILNTVKAGDPVKGSIAGVDVYLFHDRRVGSTYIENLAWANHQIVNITDEPDRSYPTTEIIQVEVPVRIQVPVLDENGDPVLDENGDPVLRWVDHPTDTKLVDQEVPLGDPLKLAADAQGAVSWFSAGSSLPASWVPDEVL